MTIRETVYVLVPIKIKASDREAKLHAIKRAKEHLHATYLTGLFTVPNALQDYKVTASRPSVVVKNADGSFDRKRR